VTSRSFWVAGRGPFEFLIESGDTVDIHLSNSAANALTSGIGMRRFARSLGLGVLRADLSIPLEPPVNRIWMEDIDAEVRLYMRTESQGSDLAVFDLGRLHRGVASWRVGRVPLLVFASDSFLPGGSLHKLIQEQQAKRAWGGLVMSVKST
jgi:hypothetical protein